MGVSAAFYAPLKSPDHPVPSGDRRMAQLFLKALQLAGFNPWVASRLRTHDKCGDPSLQQQLVAEAEREAENLVESLRQGPASARPRLWFTYHNYYKAPDLVGPRVARALSIPYVVAEGSRAPKRWRGDWALGHAAAEASLDQAAIIFVINEADRAMLEEARPNSQALVELPPFIEATHFHPPHRVSREGEAPRLLTVAMMRHGDKLRSYQLLAEALSLIVDLPWSLAIIGDGEARPEVESAFAPLGARVSFEGLVEDPARLERAYAGSDLFVWPAVNEAYGMVLLEAQQHGCPVIAGKFGGVANVVQDGSTGLLSPPGDAAALAAAVAALLDQPNRRRQMGDAARAFVTRERSLVRAAEALRLSLMPLLADD